VLTNTRERKVQTTEDLEGEIKEPMNAAPTRNVWIHEGLEDEARRMWEGADQSNTHHRRVNDILR
jgi:hypothetical protein